MLSRVASWHHGSSVSVILTPMRRRRSSSPWSVIFGNSRLSRGMRRLLGSDLGRAKRLAIDLAGRRLRQRGHECDVPRVLVLTQARAGELLQLAGERIIAGARAHDERLHHLAAER